MVASKFIDNACEVAINSQRASFQLSSRGHELSAVLAPSLVKEDWLHPHYRNKALLQARGVSIGSFFDMLFCNADSNSLGRRLSIMCHDRALNILSGVTPVGNNALQSVGVAQAIAADPNSQSIVVCGLGDGTTQQGEVLEAFLEARSRNVPVLFWIDDNGWAISVPSRAQTASSSYAAKAKAYGMPSHEVDGNDPLATFEALRALVECAREGGGPALLVLKTYRLMGHSSSDDPTKYRDESEVAVWRERDPLPRFENFLTERGLLAQGEAKSIHEKWIKTVDDEIHTQEVVDPMPLKSLVEDIYADVPVHLRKQYNDFLRVAEKLGDARPGDGAFPL